MAELETSVGERITAFALSRG